MSTVEGTWMLTLAGELEPFPRSLTGDGVRATLDRIASEISLEMTEVPSGTRVLDWEVPPEWNLREAWIEDPDGRRIVDAADSALHVVGYSQPVDLRLTLAELLPHLHTAAPRPDAVPYRTSYYEPGWGFCLSARQVDALEEGEYVVRIDADLGPGHLTFGEHVVRGRGEGDGELLVSTHVCHPAMANDNLSGLVVATALARRMEERDLRHDVRFLFVPATLGPIAWLAANRDAADRVRGGLVVSCAGDSGPPTYKRSRRGDAAVDRAAAAVFASAGHPDRVRPFEPYGYDERQYCSPGFDLPIGRLTRTPNGEYPQYHTSADDLTLLDAAALAESLELADAILAIVDGDETYRNLVPYGEPQLGRRGLYEGLRGRNRLPEVELAMLWVLNQSDGDHSLLDVSERSGLPFDVVRGAADRLVAAGLLAPADSTS